MIHLSRSSISFLQLQNQAIYGAINEALFNPVEMLPFLGGYGGRFLRAIRTNDPTRVSYWLVNATSWLMGLGNKVNSAMEAEAWNLYHGVCPDCKSFPCRGSLDHPCESMEILGSTNSPWKHSPSSLSEFQKMIGEIYHFHTLKSSADLTAEQLFKLGLEVTHFVKTSDFARLISVKKRMSAVLANFCGIATGLGVDLAAGMDVQFAKGCPTCHQKPCKGCNYPAIEII